MVAFLPVVFSLVSATYECKPTKEGQQFNCEIALNENVTLYVGRSEQYLYLGGSTRDARWLSVGVGKTMKNMLQFINHQDPKYLEQQKKDGKNTHLIAEDSYRGGSRLFKGHPDKKEILRDNADKDHMLTKAKEEEAFKRSFFSFGGGGRKTHIQLTRAKAEDYANTISIAWGEDSDDRVVNYHGKRKLVISLGSEDGSDADIKLPEELGSEIDAKFESGSRIGSGAPTLCVVSVSALLALLI